MSHPEPRIDIAPLRDAGYTFVLHQSNQIGMWRYKDGPLMSNENALKHLEKLKVNLNQRKVMKRPAWELV